MHLGLERQSSTELVSAGVRRATRELDRVEGKTKGGLDTGAESLGVAKGQDTRVVNLGFDEGSVVEVGLRTNLQVHVARCLRVVRSTGAGLNVLVHTVVVRGAVRREVAESCLLYTSPSPRDD